MILPLILIVLSFVTHFVFFGRPAEVVFDEVYNGGFVSSYTSGAYYFDVHPPLGKILVKFFGDFINTPYDIDYSVIGNSLPWGVVLLRLLPMIAGLLLPLLIYYICRHLNFSKLTAFAAGLLIILENSLLVQSRFILFDSLMILFGFAAILLYLIYVKKGGKWLIILSAILCAGAFSIKWTGMAYPLLIVLAEIVRGQKVKEVVRLLVWYVVIGLIVYLSVFAIHLGYLNRAGHGDAFMTDRFQKTLIGNEFQNAELVPKKFFGKTIELNYIMYEANLTLTTQHPYSSEWWTWPLQIRPIFYWQGTHDGEGNEYIYLLGNPFIYLMGTLSVLFLLWHFIRKRARDYTLQIILLGFLVNYIPFIFIGRVMFLYHYEAALVFSILAFVYCLEKYVPPERQKKIIISVLIVAAICFLFFAPLSYGLYLSDAALWARMWLPTWR